MDGIYCSNHGGRQANGGVPAIDCLPDVVAATAGDVPVLFDSGIRSGTDVVKALALAPRPSGSAGRTRTGPPSAAPTASCTYCAPLLAEADLLMAVDGYPSLDDLTPRRCAACDSERHVAPIDHRQPPAREAKRTSRTELDELLDSTPLATIALIRDGHPVIFPIGFARIGDELVIHGSTGSPWLRQLADGRGGAVSVTTLDGVMVARCGFESSFRFRSAVLFGTFERIGDEDKVGYLDQLVDTFIPGRVAELRQLAQGTGRDHGAAHADRGRQLVAEGRRRLARGPDEDIAAGVWAGVVR